MQQPVIPVKARRLPRKHKIPRMVQSFGGTIFIVRKSPLNKVEQDIVIHFGSAVPYRVVKLSPHGLPHKTAGGKRIKWINNFGVVDRRGDYVDGVKYSVLLPALSNDEVYVTVEDGQLKDLPLCGLFPGAQIVQAELDLGDPGVGIRPKEGVDEPVTVDPKPHP